MSAILPWWKERLEARCPISEISFVEGYYKRRTGVANDPWLDRVARSRLYLDYQSWYEKTIRPKYDNDHYRQFPEQIPQYASELTFFTTMGPLIYVRGKEWHVRNYSVKVSRPFEGKILIVKVRRYFVKMADYEEHVDAFKRETGLALDLPKERPRGLDGGETLC